MFIEATRNAVRHFGNKKMRNKGGEKSIIVETCSCLSVTSRRVYSCRRGLDGDNLCFHLASPKGMIYPRKAEVSSILPSIGAKEHFKMESWENRNLIIQWFRIQEIRGNLKGH